MKLVLMTLMVFTLLPSYAIAQRAPHSHSKGQSSVPKATSTNYTSYTRTSAPRWIKPSSAMIAQIPLTPDTGTPDGRRTPGGARPELSEACKPTKKPITALVPENSKGLTTARHPVFWFYIPYTPEEIHSIEFSLHDRNEITTLYRTSPQPPRTPGVVGIPLPSSPEQSLKVDESYRWRLIVNCDRTETPENILELNGWVTRVQHSSNPWYDQLTSLAQRYLLEPKNSTLKKAWVELLQSVGLEELAQAPLVSELTNRSQS